MDSSTPLTDSFLLDAVEAYFLAAGFDCDRPRDRDFEAIGSGGYVRWLVEVVGGPAVDSHIFQQKLGRLLTHMDAGPGTNYLLAIPRTPGFMNECALVPHRVREMLNLWWCVVDQDCVLLVKPNQKLELLNTWNSTLGEGA